MTETEKKDLPTEDSQQTATTEAVKIEEVKVGEDKPTNVDEPKMSPEEKEIEQKMVKVISAMPAKIQDRFKMLHVYSDRRSKLNDEFNKEMQELNKKYEARKKPFLDKRDLILDGNFEDFTDYLPLFDAHKAKLKSFVAGIVKSEEDKEKEAEEEKERKPLEVASLEGKKGVPDFWVRVLKNNPMTKQLIMDHDWPILEHLTGITCAEGGDDETRVTVEMHFSSNDFFDNASLTFTCIHDDDGESTKEVIGEEIQWKTGINVTKKKVKKTQKNKKTGEKRVIYKVTQQDSLFNMFESKKMPEQLDSDGEDSEDEKAMQMIQDNHDFATDVYDMYQGEALEYYLCPDSLDFADLLGQGPEGDDSDEDDDDEEAPKQPKKKAAAKKEGEGEDAGAAGDEEKKKEECKQQ